MDLTKMRRDRNFASHYPPGVYPVCPRCGECCFRSGRADRTLMMQPDRPATSRVDGSEICAECGTEEALIPFVGAEAAREWVRSRMTPDPVLPPLEEGQ